MRDSKELKEAWVSNRPGSEGVGEICLLLAIAPIATLFQRVLSGALNISKRDVRGTGLLAFLTDFGALVFPMILVFHVWDDVAYLYAVLLLSSFLAVLSSPSQCLSGLQHTRETLGGPQKPFLTNFRTIMMLCTCIAILAVDFKFFPRHFAKTEDYGVSLMDTGVGGFVFSLGLVSFKARSGSAHHHPSWASNLITNLWAMIPTLALGLGRFFWVRLFNYHEHVSEYGIHWNFFLTLAFVNLFGVILDVPIRYTGPLGILILIFYQFLLSNSLFQLEHYIQFHPRVDIISQNKEGIFSLFGYTSLYLLSSHLGYYILKQRKRIREWYWVLAVLFLSSFICWFFGYVILESTLGILPSRKMANITYVFYVLVVVLSSLAFLLLLDLFIIPQNHLLIDTISKRRHSQLMVFLLANVFTGLVNVTIPTTKVTPLMGFLIVTVYMFAVCAFPYVYWVRQTRQKPETHVKTT